MRWVKLSQESLAPAVVEGLRMLLDVPADLVGTAWQQLRQNTAYRIFRLRLGTEREIHLPSEVLRELQLRALTRVLYTGPVSPAAYAGVPGRSLIHAARTHLDRAAGQVVAFDIQDAYGSTTYSHVIGALRQRLRREMWVLGLSSDEQAGVLGALGYFLTTRRPKGPGRQLPLGAPTSVALFNLICLELDGDLLRLLNEERYQGLTPAYTRYVDDMVFSGTKPFRKEFLTEVKQTVSRHDYRLNDAKTRRMQLRTATIYGLQRTDAGLEPSKSAKARLAKQIREHLAVAGNDKAPPRRRLQSLSALRSIDGYLRQFYESARLARPENLRFEVPPHEAEALHHLDLLWD
jgi:hypothetical protein